jgi:hypothetical protein
MGIQTRPSSWIGFSLSTIAIFTGCALQEPEPEETIAEDSAASTVTNNVFLNGGNLNGGNLNGGNLNGGNLNGGNLNGGNLNGSSANLVGFTFDLTTVTGVTVNGASIQGAWIDNGTLSAMRSDGAVLSGQALVGAEMTGKLSNGQTVTLRLDALEPFTSTTGTALSRYVISFTGPHSTARAYVCGKDDAGAPIKTIPITGQWNFEQGVPGGGSKEENPALVTFACQGFVLYKCIDFGYPPWKKANGVRLNNHHQACVRMLRADYCGDGRSWTVNGTAINMYDNLGIQADTESWAVEAEWDTDGARCLSHQRIQNMGTVPSCPFDRSPTACGNPPQWGPTLLVSEAP